jgi:hypothetical protein
VGLGFWGGVCGFGGLAQTPNPQSPIPNPQSPKIIHIKELYNIKNKIKINNNLILLNNKNK